MAKIAYLYRYALKYGVLEVDVENFKESYPKNGDLYGRWFERYKQCSMREGKDFSYSLEEAELKFNDMKNSKHESLVKQIEKNKQQTFKLLSREQQRECRFKDYW